MIRHHWKTFRSYVCPLSHHEPVSSIPGHALPACSSSTFCESTQALLLHEASLLQSELKIFISLKESWVICRWQELRPYDASLCICIPRTRQFLHIEWRSNLDILAITTFCESCLGLWISSSSCSSELLAFLKSLKAGSQKCLYYMSKNCSRHKANEEKSDHNPLVRLSFGFRGLTWAELCLDRLWAAPLPAPYGKWLKGCWLKPRGCLSMPDGRAVCFTN